MKASFLNHSRPLITAMLQAKSPERTEELLEKALAGGADAVGMQLCQFEPRYRNREVYERIFKIADRVPVYATNYRARENAGKSDETLAEELLELAECGATLCDVMGDYFCPTEGEFTTDPVAIEKQKKLISDLHARGAEVLMSSHVLKFTPAERVLEIALGHKERGADICKIVVGADTMEQQIENLRIINLLKEKLDIPFLFLSGGECRIVRRIGGEIGCCMYLCVCEYDELATKAQPLISDIVSVREMFDNAN